MYKNLMLVMIGLYISILEIERNSISISGFRKLLAEPLKLGFHTPLQG